MFFEEDSRCFPASLCRRFAPSFRRRFAPSYSRVLAAVLIFFTVFLSAGCAKPNYQNAAGTSIVEPTASGETCALSLERQPVCVDLRWSKWPTNSDTGVFDLFFSQKDGRLFVPPSDVSVVLWMPSMGHGSSPTAVSPNADGSFHVTHVFFIMPGEWEIRIALKEGPRVIDQAVQKINF